MGKYGQTYWCSLAQVTYIAVTNHSFHSKDEYHQIPLGIFRKIGFLKLGFQIGLLTYSSP